MKKVFLVILAIPLVAAFCNAHQTYLMQERVVDIKNHKYTVQLADTPEERSNGLSGIPQIGEEEGMLFLFSYPQNPAFWMKDMKFPIDIIWINGNTIIQIDDNIKPMPNTPVADLPTYTPSSPADKVLEVNAGWAFRHDVQIGDTVLTENP